MLKFCLQPQIIVNSYVTTHQYTNPLEEDLLNRLTTTSNQSADMGLMYSLYIFNISHTEVTCLNRTSALKETSINQIWKLSPRS